MYGYGRLLVCLGFELKTADYRTQRAARVPAWGLVKSYIPDNKAHTTYLKGILWVAIPTVGV